MKRTTSLAVLALGALGALPAAAQNWRMMQNPNTGFQDNVTNAVVCTDRTGFMHRTNHTMTWYLNPSGQGAGKDTAIQNALNQWTNVPNADFDLFWGGYNWSAGYRQADGINSMVWGIDPVCDGSSCHAITSLLLGPGQVIQEADILFNANPNRAFQWMTNGSYSPNCWQTAGSSGLMLDTQGIATHELGHAMGIAHPIDAQTTFATMGIRACTTDARTVEADDIAALRCAEDRYPANPAYQGAIMSMGCTAITGWAWNQNRSYERNYVEIVEDGANGPILHAVTQANLYRPDLGGLPDPYHGFSYSPTGNLRIDGNWHVMRARYTGNQANVGNFSYLLMCGHDMFPQTMGPSDPPLSTNGQSYEVGVQFKSDYSGYITHVGFYFAPGEASAPSHTVKLWTDSGQLLASAPVNPPVITGQSGWSYASIGRVWIQANTNYRASVDTYNYQAKSSCGSSTSLSNPYSSSPLTALQGLWRTGVGQVPNVGSCGNYFVSVRYDSG